MKDVNQLFPFLKDPLRGMKKHITLVYELTLKNNKKFSCINRKQMKTSIITEEERQKAFKSIKKHGCKACTCSHVIEYNYMFSLNLSVIIDWGRLIFGSKKNILFGK